MIEGVARRVSSLELVGRDAELAQLRRALEGAAAGQPAIVVVAGEAGVGKTRLVAELLHDAASFGAVALTGGCLDVGEGVLAYAPLVEALRSLARGIDPTELGRVLGTARGELARLVPELAPPDGREVPPAPAAAAGPLAPTRLFELLLGVLHRLAEQTPVLLVVEDLHWADQSTRNLLGFLVRNLRGGVALVLTYRSDELHRRHPLRPFVAELDRSGGAERLELGRLGRRELAELLAGILDAPPPPALVGEILARSEGNPFFAEELLAAHLEGARLPLALRDLLLARVEALPEPAQRVTQAAAVAGTRVDHELLAAVVGHDADELVRRLREAVSHHVLVVDQASGAYVFRHALVQEAVYDDLLPVQRAPLHAAYARALERRIEQRTERRGERQGGAVTAAERGQLAYHWYAAHDQGQALLACVQAGLAAESAAALAEALEHYERALELWDRVPAAAARSSLDRVAVLRRAAEAANLAGRYDRAVILARLALDRVDESTAPLDPQVAAPVLAELAEVAVWDGRLADARAAVAEGLAVLAAAEEPSWITLLCRTGLAVEAAAAERARDHRATAEQQAAHERATGLLARIRAATQAPNVVVTPVVEANLLTAEAEWSRITGPSDPERWARGAAAWEALRCPWLAAYARWRQAEALLAQRAPRDAAAALHHAWTLASGHDARLLAAEIGALARRARIELALQPSGGAADTPAARVAAAPDPLGLTPREREVLALLADGRTNRQIAATLFISVKTAGVHVSNILAKLGVASRGEAAAVAHRLRRSN